MQKITYSKHANNHELNILLDHVNDCLVGRSGEGAALTLRAIYNHFYPLSILPNFFHSLHGETVGFPIGWPDLPEFNFLIH